MNLWPIDIKGDQSELSVGPSAILELAMTRAEKTLDQKLALKRWTAIQTILEGLTFIATKNYLLAVSEGTLRARSTTEKQTLQNDVKKIESLEVEDVVKMKLFAFRLTEEISIELFKSFAEAAKKELSTEIASASRKITENLQRIEAAKNALPNLE